MSGLHRVIAKGTSSAKQDMAEEAKKIDPIPDQLFCTLACGNTYPVFWIFLSSAPFRSREYTFSSAERDISNYFNIPRNSIYSAYS